jgi:dTDP-4-amino-4,6-dideoxygalactose transaminase|tara:strand:+ start:1125 stop:2180 length:1056 start_codon:yes stop_codon:yes gene_type:complete
MTGWNIEYEHDKEKYAEIFDEAMRIPRQEGDLYFLENTIAHTVGRKFAVAVNSGTEALFFALKAHHIETGDEVLVSSFSWHSSATCVAMTGATAVFCEIDADSYHMSLASIIRMTTEHTKAIVYPHLFGNMSEISEIRRFCEEQHITFIEDACQSIGASRSGIKAGSIGACSAMSFNANKNIAGIAGGGAIMTDDFDMWKRLKKMRQHGDGEFLGYNSKMQMLNAMIIHHRLSHIEKWQNKRQSYAKVYRNALSDMPIKMQGDVSVNHNYHKFVVQFEDQNTRDMVKEMLGATIHYPKAIMSNIMWKNISSRTDQCPNAHHAARTVLTLPMHHYSRIGELDETINMIEKLL